MLKSKTNNMRYICTYMVICHPCSSRLVLPAFSRRHLCQNRLLSFMSFLRPHSSAIFPSPLQHLMSRGALKIEVSNTLMLPIIFSMHGNRCPRLLMHLIHWEQMQQKFTCKTNGGQLHYRIESQHWH